MDINALMRGLAGETVKSLSFSYDISKAKPHIEHLNSRMKSYDSEIDYNAGDIIEWKPGLMDCSAKFPAYGQPVYCVSVGSVREPCEKKMDGAAVEYEDMVYCIYHEDVDGICFFLADSHRFRKYRKPSE